MEKIMILNASPRAPRSNSKQYAGLFTRYWPGESEYFELRHDNHSALIERMEAFSDGLPSGAGLAPAILRKPGMDGWEKKAMACVLGLDAGDGIGQRDRCSLWRKSRTRLQSICP